ncbi:hypothetical protein CEXT_314211 [Caerostris extrusa]|uniref:Uncharacterized protein n=1 Tax=Caerostris extrusa TaxID=172846 RepID=A0AAV4XH18_CAEEX|nr:hypothetical protein CEXT_314211 [Caerostris extrusa]
MSSKDMFSAQLLATSRYVPRWPKSSDSLSNVEPLVNVQSANAPSAYLLVPHTCQQHPRKLHHADDRDEEVHKCQPLVPQVPTSTLYSISALSPSVRISCHNKISGSL